MDDKKTLSNTSKKTGLLYQAKLNQNQAAQAIGVSVETFRRWRKEAKLPQPLKVGGHNFWLERDLEQWLIDQNPHLQFQAKLAMDAERAKQKLLAMQAEKQQQSGAAL